MTASFIPIVVAPVASAKRFGPFELFQVLSIAVADSFCPSSGLRNHLTRLPDYEHGLSSILDRA